MFVKNLRRGIKMKFRKKPVVIEAVQFNGWIEGTGNLNLTERPDWLINEFGKRIIFFNAPDSLAIKTLEGEMLASKGDWIIKGINGELYPCKPDIFEKTYEMVEEQ
jgi:hypothetical protein